MPTRGIYVLMAWIGPVLISGLVSQDQSARSMQFPTTFLYCIALSCQLALRLPSRPIGWRILLKSRTEKHGLP